MNQIENIACGATEPIETQDDEFVVVAIRVRHVRADDMDFYVLDEEFKFYCNFIGIESLH